MPPSVLLTVLAIGAVVGLLPGLFGVGGAFVTVPALHMLAGIPLELAIGSSACQVLGPATTGLLHRRGTGMLQLRMPLVMLGGTGVGVWLGMRFVAWAGQSDETWQIAGRTVPRLETVMMLCYFLLLVTLAVVVSLEWYYRRRRGHTADRGRLEAWALPPLGIFPELDGRSFSIPILAGLAALVGFLNSGMGMGGGILLMPALISLVGVSPQRAITVSLALTWFGGIGTTVGHALNDRVDLWLVCLLLAGGTIGAKVGSQLGERLGGERLRGYFALVILLVAVVIGVRLISLFRG